MHLRPFLHRSSPDGLKPDFISSSDTALKVELKPQHETNNTHPRLKVMFARVTRNLLSQSNSLLEMLTDNYSMMLYNISSALAAVFGAISLFLLDRNEYTFCSGIITQFE